jgi:hypothetical protein
VREVRGECERCEVSGERERCDVRASRREASARVLTVHTGRDGSRSPIRGILEVVRIGEEREWRDLLQFVLYWETTEVMSSLGHLQNPHPQEIENRKM